MPSRLTLAALCAAFVALADADYATDTYTMVSGGEITTITDTYLANYYDSAVPIYTVSSWCGDGADSVSASLCISEVASSLDYYSYGCSFERVVSVCISTRCDTDYSDLPSTCADLPSSAVAIPTSNSIMSSDDGSNDDSESTDESTGDSSQGSTDQPTDRPRPPPPSQNAGASPSGIVPAAIAGFGAAVGGLAILL